MILPIFWFRSIPAVAWDLFSSRYPGATLQLWFTISRVRPKPIPGFTPLPKATLSSVLINSILSFCRWLPLQAKPWLSTNGCLLFPIIKYFLPF